MLRRLHARAARVAELRAVLPRKVAHGVPGGAAASDRNVQRVEVREDGVGGVPAATKGSQRAHLGLRPVGSCTAWALKTSVPMCTAGGSGW